MRISRVETIRLADTPFVLYVRLHTDEGLVGTGDTFMAAEGIEGYIHGRAAPKLLGQDAGDIGRIWSALYDWDAARFGGQGIEVRAISAIDVALWDLLGQAVGRPIYQLLGGAMRDRLPIYNTCGGRPTVDRRSRPTVARARSRTCTPGTTRRASWPRSSCPRASRP